MNVRGDFLKFPHSTNTTALICKSRKENPQKLTQLNSRSHPRHLVGKRTAQKDITIDTTSDSQLSLLRNSVVRLTDQPNMTIAVYRGRK